MKAYVFIVMSICQIGGSEQYIYNKMKYLTEKQYDVFVFSGLTREILIEGLRKYNDYIIPALMYAPCYFTKSEVKRTLSRIRSTVDPSRYEKIIIETDGIDEAKWGEMLASDLKCRHLLLNVQEAHNYTDEEIEFLKFKLKREELYGITDKSVSMMLKDENGSYPNTAFSAFCNNVVDNVNNPFAELMNKNADYTIGSIGRLEKDCVLPIIEELLLFLSLHSEKKYNLVMIGGSKETKRIKTIKTKVSSCPNTELIITGNLYPIPRDLINRIDVFVSTAGSASVSYMEGKPTIKVNPNNGIPCGVIGYNYKGNMFDTLTDETVHGLIEKILTKQIVPEYKPELLRDYYIKMEKEFDRQLTFGNCYAELEYYDIKKTNFKVNAPKKLFYYFLGKIFGGNKMQKILEWLRQCSK